MTKVESRGRGGMKHELTDPSHVPEAIYLLVYTILIATHEKNIQTSNDQVNKSQKVLTSSHMHTEEMMEV